MNCPNCSNVIDAKTTYCPYCNEPVEDYGASLSGSRDATVPMSTATVRNPIVSRYLDLYRAARLLVGIGTTVKTIGMIVGVAIVLLCLFAGVAGSSQPSTFGQQSSVNTGFLFGTFVVGAVFGTFTGGVIFLLGILISAQGQILLAQADGAIHTSPFLNNEERAAAMSLRYKPPAGEAVIG